MAMINKEKFRNNLLQALARNGMTARALADKANISESSISHYLSGNIAPSKATLQKIANVLHMDPNELLGIEQTVEFIDTNDKIKLVTEFSQDKNAYRIMDYYLRLNNSGKKNFVDFISNMSNIDN